MTKTTKGTILFVCIVAMLASMFVGILFYAANIVQVFGLPRMGDAEIDIGGQDLESFNSSIILKGKWEFFYNKWIVAEYQEGVQPDGYIKVNQRWTSKVYNGTTLPKSGYASYRMYIKNIQAGQEITCTIGYYPNAYRVFINGKLCAVSGVMSKDAKETFTASHPSEVNFYTVAPGEVLEVVVEISANNNGGLINWPITCTEHQYEKVYEYNAWHGNAIYYIAIGFALPIIISVFILNFQKIYKTKNNSIIIMVLALLLRYVLSYDVLYRIIFLLPAIDFRAIHFTSYITSAIFYVTLINVLYRHNILHKKKNNKELAVFTINIISATFYIITYGHSAMFVFLAVPFLTMLYYIFYVCQATVEKKKFASTYLLLVVFVFIDFGLIAGELSGLFLLNIAGALSYTLIIIMATVLMVYLVQIKDRIYQSKKAASLEKEITEVKHQALKSQIKPHFVFNMLTTIQDLYHKSTDAGDGALTKFSRHLRLNIDSEYKDLIDFEKELDNIQNYFDLENMRREGKLNLLYDIEYTDFKLPILSLQPLVENAVKYAQSDKKEDGFIQIRSYLEEDNIVVEVKDNGIGFDLSEIKNNSIGLKNTSQRLKYSLDADFIINSEKGVGTTIKIILSNNKQ